MPVKTSKKASSVKKSSKKSKSSEKPVEEPVQEPVQEAAVLVEEQDETPKRERRVVDRESVVRDFDSLLQSLEDSNIFVRLMQKPVKTQV